MLLAALLLGCSPGLTAAFPGFPQTEAGWAHENWGRAKGLPDNAAERLLLSRDGWLWIGTRSGLARFDGNDFIIYDEKTPGFSSDAILDLVEDSSGSIWIATKKGLFRKSGDSFRRYTTRDGLLSEMVLDLEIDPDGGLWIATQLGLNRFKDERVQSFPRPMEKVEARLNSEAARSALGLASTADGSVWVGTESGLHQFNLASGWHVDHPTEVIDPEYADKYRRRLPFVDSRGTVWVGSDIELFRKTPEGLVPLNLPAESGDLRPRRIVEGPDGTIWMVRAGLIYTITDGRIVPFPTPFGIADAFITDLIPGPDNEFWISTRHAGLHRIRPSAFRIYTTRDGLPNNIVSSVSPALEGGVWVGTQRGFRRFNNGVFIKPKTNLPEIDYPVQNLFEDSSTNLWVGTAESWPGWPRAFHSLYFARKPETLIPADAWPGGSAQALFEDSKGRVWEGGAGGIVCYPSDRKILEAVGKDGSRIIERPNVEHQLTGGWLFTDDQVFRYLGKTAHWIMEKAGIHQEGHREWKLKLQNIERESLPENPLAESPLPLEKEFASYDIRAIAETSDGAIWFGSWGGGLHRSLNGKLTIWSVTNGLPDSHVYSILADADNSLWLGTPQGLAHARLSGTRPDGTPSLAVETFNTTHGLPSNEIHQLLDDGLGNLWMGTKKGICRISRTQLTTSNSLAKTKVLDALLYDAEDGLFANSTANRAQPASCRSSDGRLWFATSSGLVAIDPRLGPSKPRNPQAWIDSVLARGQHFNVGSRPGYPPKEIQLPPQSGRSVEIQFTALNAARSGNAQFRYRLSGVDLEWVNAGARRSAFYTKLEHGQYRFDVETSNRDGTWNSPGASLIFTILPTYWENKRQLVLSAATFLLVSGLGLLIQSQYSKTKRAQADAALSAERASIAAEKERIATERTRMVNHLHDLLGAYLSRLSLLGERVMDNPALVHEIAELVRKIFFDLNSIVSIIRKEDENLEHLIDCVIEYSQSVLSADGINLNLDLPLEIPAAPLPSGHHQAVYLTIREALHNILRHAKARNVQMTVKINAGLASISIEDDGQWRSGFGDKKEGITVSNTESRLDNPSGGGLGLISMRKRMEEIGGTFQVRFGTDRGTTVQLRFAIPTNNA